MMEKKSKPELELKQEHTGNHATFLDFDIILDEGKIISKWYDKRDEFSFFTVGMPNLHSYIPSSIFYGTVKSEVLRIARASSLLTDFSEKNLSLNNENGKTGRG